MGMFVGGVLNGATIIWSFAGGWEHVSVCPRNRTATWDEMSMIKNLFWNDDEFVMQLHPAKSEYVNNMRYCLHLWKPIEKYSGSIPVPDSLLVGCKYVGTVG